MYGDKKREREKQFFFKKELLWLPFFFLTGLHLFWRVSTSPAVCPGIIGFFFFFAKFIFATQWPLFVVDFQARLPGFTGFFFLGSNESRSGFSLLYSRVRRVRSRL